MEELRSLIKELLMINSGEMKVNIYLCLRDGNDGSNIENEDPKERVDVFQEQGLSILRTICAGAVEARPSSMILRENLEATF